MTKQTSKHFLAHLFLLPLIKPTYSHSLHALILHTHSTHSLNIHTPHQMGSGIGTTTPLWCLASGRTCLALPSPVWSSTSGVLSVTPSMLYTHTCSGWRWATSATPPGTSTRALHVHGTQYHVTPNFQGGIIFKKGFALMQIWLVYLLLPEESSEQQPTTKRTRAIFIA